MRRFPAARQDAGQVETESGWAWRTEAFSRPDKTVLVEAFILF